MDRWSSRTGFLLATVGAAVGLGNIWRFPAVVGQNGGGAYLVTYLFAAFVFAVPLMILELSVGRSLRLDVVSAFRSVRPEFEALGWLVAGSVVLILSYYLVLTGWVLAFFLSALGGSTPSFGSFTASTAPLAYFTVATVATGAIVSFGVRSGIERMSKVVMPVVVLLLLGLAGYVTTLPGFADGVSFLLTPDVAVLSDPLLWSAAFGQVFFSLSVGQGIMLTYGSYLGEDANVARSAVVIAVADIGVAVLAGLVIFPVVFSFGLEPTLGTELAFTTLPEAFAAMRYGSAVAAAFFGLLFLAALSSSVALLEVGTAAALRTTDRSRTQVVAGATVLVFLLGLPSALSYSSVRLALFGSPVLDVLDESVGTFALPVSAVLIAVVFTWFQGDDALHAQVGDSVVAPLTKYVLPVVLVVVTAITLTSSPALADWQTLPDVMAVGRPLRIGIAVGALLALLAAGRVVAKRYPSRLRRLR